MRPQCWVLSVHLPAVTLVKVVRAVQAVVLIRSLVSVLPLLLSLLQLLSRRTRIYSSTPPGVYPQI